MVCVHVLRVVHTPLVERAHASIAQRYQKLSYNLNVYVYEWRTRSSAKIKIPIGVRARASKKVLGRTALSERENRTSRNPANVCDRDVCTHRDNVNVNERFVRALTCPHDTTLREPQSIVCVCVLILMSSRVRPHAAANTF